MSSSAGMRLRIAIATTTFCSVLLPGYVVSGIEPAPFVEWFLEFGPLLTVILWLIQDAQRRSIGAVQDLGFFLMLFWPIVIPWYAFASRGRAGWKLLIGLVALIAAPTVTAMLAWYVAYN